jgi:hypothetical protein
VKTRLCPPCTPDEAAAVARAALADTLDAVAAASVGRRVLALDGAPGDWLPAGFEIVDQRGAGLDERLAHAFADLGGPTVLVGMDTPQVDAGVLDGLVATLCEPGTDSLLGRATDGGWWTIGLRVPDPDCFVGVPMSRPDTGDHQHRRLLDRGLHPRAAPALTDVDRFDDALAVARSCPHGRFGRAVLRVAARIGP